MGTRAKHTPMVASRIPHHLKLQLRVLAATQDRSMGRVIQTAVEEYLTKHRVAPPKPD